MAAQPRSRIERHETERFCLRGLYDLPHVDPELMAHQGYLVYKTDVYRLAWYRNTIRNVIPEAILTKAPSAELRPDQKDEDSLPPYDILDTVLYLYIEKNLSSDAILRKLKKRVSSAVVAEVIHKVDHNEYKRRQTPPVLRVSEKAWFGRRMPITNRFKG